MATTNAKKVAKYTTVSEFVTVFMSEGYKALDNYTEASVIFGCNAPAKPKKDIPSTMAIWCADKIKVLEQKIENIKAFKLECDKLDVKENFATLTSKVGVMSDEQKNQLRAMLGVEAPADTPTEAPAEPVTE